MESVAIIGGGIGGLTLAAYLTQSGIPVKVYEKTPHLGEVGAGLGLWSNATLALKQIGIDDSYWKEFGCDVHFVEVANPEGKTLSRFNVRALSDEYESGSFIVHRADLHRGIADRVPNDRIITGKQCEQVEHLDNGARIHFTDGSSAHASVVIGADGLHSKVRESLFGKIPPRYSGQTCYRGIAKLSIDEQHVIREVQGKGLRSAVIPLTNDTAYWWATECTGPDSETDPANRKARLAELFDGWAFGFPEALEATPNEFILRNDLYDRAPASTWSAGCVGLIGDAAHPTTPNLGQGACLAIEDGIELGRELVTHLDDPSRALSIFERRRMKRCYDIVKQSRQFGWMGSWANPLAVQIRENIISAMPDSMMQKQLESHVGYRIA